ncbi:MAG: 3'(2'),5'-bisphosphate nucleotidase CysQ, partial [Hyphomonadaceae bacterium]
SNGEFTVNIALIEHGAPILGVVFAPAKNALYAGDAAAGHAFKGEWDGRSGKALRPLSPINVLPRSGAWRVTASRRSGGPKTQSFLDALGAIEEKPSSSSVKFGLIAEGAVDLYPRIGEVSEWDAAAGHAVLKAAGGGIMRLTGEDVRYGRAGWKFIIDGFVAYGDAASEAAARAILERFKWTGV